MRKLNTRCPVARKRVILPQQIKKTTTEVYELHITRASGPVVPFLLGEKSGIDYLGESRQWPTVAYNSGLLDRTATPRRSLSAPELVERKIDGLCCTSRCAHADVATDPATILRKSDDRSVVLRLDTAELRSARGRVEVYSNCEQVELFLNGKSHGEKIKPVDDSPRIWKVPFMAGTLSGVAKTRESCRVIRIANCWKARQGGAGRRSQRARPSLG